MSRLAWILLGTFTLCIAVRGVGITYADIDTELLVAVLRLGVLVGLSEELLFRGIFLRCMRNGQMSEGAAALWTATAFGLFHLPNVFLGTGLTGLLQVLLAGLSGIALYYFRVAFAAIVVGMVMHGLFDVTTFLSADYGATWSTRGGPTAAGPDVAARRCGRDPPLPEGPRLPGHPAGTVQMSQTQHSA